MKAVYHSGASQIDLLSPPDDSSPKLTIFGQVEKLTVNGKTIWFPTLIQIEDLLDQYLPAEIYKAIPFIEGQYFMIFRKEGKIFVFCDLYSVYSAFYRVWPDRIEFFDRILTGEKNLTVSQAAAISFLLFGYIPGRHSLFDDIFRMMPGECMMLDTETGERRIDVADIYPKISHDEEPSEEEAGRTFHGLVCVALEKRVCRFGPNEKLLVPISGGLDSRYLLGTVLELFPPSRIITTTFGQKGTFDYEIGKQVAREAGVRHIEYPLSPKDFNIEGLTANCVDTDGQIYFTAEAPLKVYQDYAQHAKVVLSGIMIDGVMGAKYVPEFQGGKDKIALLHSMVRIDDPLSSYLDPEILESSFYYGADRELSLDAAEGWLLINRLTKYTQHCIYKNFSNLTYVSPFYDYAVMDYTSNMPRRMRLNRGLQVYWLRNHFRKLSEIPCTNYQGIPVTSSDRRIYLAIQWERVVRHLLKITRNVNKIDLVRYHDQILGADISKYQVFSALPAKVGNIIKQPYYNEQHYVLKSLEILKTDFNVDFQMST
jgi:hypothetical protein